MLNRVNATRQAEGQHPMQTLATQNGMLDGKPGIAHNPQQRTGGYTAATHPPVPPSEKCSVFEILCQRPGGKSGVYCSDNTLGTVNPATCTLDFRAETIRGKALDVFLSMFPAGLVIKRIAGTVAARIGAAATERGVAAARDALLRKAATGTGMFGLGQATVAQAREAGMAWVGPGARLASDGKRGLARMDCGSGVHRATSRAWESGNRTLSHARLLRVAGRTTVTLTLRMRNEGKTQPDLEF